MFTSGGVTRSQSLPLDLSTYEVGLERGVDEDVAAQEPVATVVGAHLVTVARRLSGESPGSERLSGESPRSERLSGESPRSERLSGESPRSERLSSESPSVGNPPAGQSGCSAGS